MYLDKSNNNLYGPKADTGWGVPLALKGEDGEKGGKGDKGNTEAKGDKGDPGTDGAEGTKIYNGSIGPIATWVAVGDFFLNTSTGDLYRSKTISGRTTAPINLKSTANVVSSAWFQAKTWSTGSGSHPLHSAA